MITLPINCEATYNPTFLDVSEADALFTELLENYDVTNKVIKMADGSDYLSGTGVYMFADDNLLSFDALPEAWGARSSWPDSLSAVRDRVEDKTGIRFQVARCVFYRDGSEGMGFHVDEPAYGSTTSIASISLGSEREFVFRSLSDPDDEFSILLANGSLLFMGEYCQQRYQHALPTCETSDTPRINLTFRKYGWE